MIVHTPEIIMSESEPTTPDSDHFDLIDDFYSDDFE